MIVAINQAIPPRILQELTKQGVSDNLEKMLADARNHLEMPVSWAKAPLLASLSEIGIECGKPDWGGNGERSVSTAALHEAALLIRLLPYTVALPNLSVTPAGAISFEWRNGESNRVMLVLSGARKIIYAALLPGGRQEHGSEPFVSTLSERIERLILGFKAVK